MVATFARRLRVPAPSLLVIAGVVVGLVPGVPAITCWPSRSTPSGVTAVVVASVILGTQATRLTNARIRLQLSAVFQTVVFLLESVVFGLIGLQLPALFRGLAVSTSVGHCRHWRSPRR